MYQPVLLLGAGGQLGRELRRQAPGDIDLHAFDSSRLDITDWAQVEAVFQALAPGVVINAAAYTRVDQAESEPERAFAVNAAGVENVARAAGGARVIHFSTDFVFDGEKGAPYLPGDRPAPLNVYGASKLEGERLLLKFKGESSVIIRTAWLYSPWGGNFFTNMLRLMGEREHLRVVADQHGSPTSVRSLAGVVWRFVDNPGLRGVYHWTDAGEAAWFDFALEIQRQAFGHGLLDRRIAVEPVTTAEYPTAAARPRYSVLDSSATEAAVGFPARPWREELEETITRLKTAPSASKNHNRDIS